MRHTGSDPGGRRRTAPPGALRGHGTESGATARLLTRAVVGHLRRVRVRGTVRGGPAVGPVRPGMFRTEEFGQSLEPSVGGGADGAGPLAQGPRRALRVEPDDHPEHDGLGLVLRQLGDEDMVRSVSSASMASPAVSDSAARAVSSVSSPPIAGRRLRIRRWSSERLRAIRAAQPRNRSASPLKRSRSRAIWSHASDATSSASGSPTSVRM